MNTIAIDRDMLNGLFDNQKKLDDLFDSIFDEDDYFINSSPSPSQSENLCPAFEVENQFSYSSGNIKELLLAIKQNHFFYLLPIIVEITVIYLVTKNLL